VLQKATQANEDTMFMNNQSQVAGLVAIVIAGLLPATQLHAEPLKVVVTSKAIHSLVASVMEGTSKPTLLVDGSASPHSFAMKPSGASALASADVFFRVSESIEPFTGKLVKSLPKSVKQVTLAQAPGLVLLKRRTGATFDTKDAHDHDDHDHGADANDGHVWLDPTNAKAMAKHITDTLAKRDPANKAAYLTNLNALETKLDALTTELIQITTPIKGRPFIVFHDATQYFEARFGLTAVGAITVSPDVPASAKRLTAVRQKISKLSAVCVFAEPLFQPNLVAAVTENTTAKPGTLDPEATALDAGPDLYFALMRGLATATANCLKPAA
jgi:zinc transport system substrate-binding protein